MRKIDIHCHATNRPLSHTVSHRADLYTIGSEMKKHEILHTVLLASYFPPANLESNKGTGISNFRMRNWIDRMSRSKCSKRNFVPASFMLFGSLDFEKYFYQGLNELEELARTPLIGIRGVKIYTGYQNIIQSDLEEVLKLCSRYKIPIMFHTGDCAGSRGHVSIDHLDGLVEKYDKVNFIYTHLCNPNMGSVIERVKRYRNVYTDMSGMVHSGKDDHEIPEAIENLKRFYGECGTSRLMFGTDFPVQTHEHSVLLATQGIDAVANPDERDNFWYGNAARLLKI